MTRDTYIARQAELEIEMCWYIDYMNWKITEEELKQKGMDTMVDTVYSNILYEEHSLDSDGNFTGWSRQRKGNNDVRFAGKAKMQEIIKAKILEYFPFME